jgi:hypothetical protein
MSRGGAQHGLRSAASCAAKYHREDLNLCQRRSHCRVPSLERWRICSSSPRLLGAVRSMNPRFLRAFGRSGGNRTLRSFAPNERIEAWLTLSIIVSPEITAVAMDGIEPSVPEARVQHGLRRSCEQRDERAASAKRTDACEARVAAGAKRRTAASEPFVRSRLTNGSRRG